METLDFIGLAQSTDKYRPNLTGIYRDKEHYAATDGHRLHYVNGLPKVEKGFYLDNRDCQFPNWQQIMPTGKVKHTDTVIIGKDDVKKLTALLGLLKACGKEERACTVVFRGDILELSISHGKTMLATVEATLKLNLQQEPSDKVYTPKEKIDLFYLCDVLVSAGKYNPNGIGVKISCYDDGKPWQFEIPKLGNAIIMPMKAPK